VSEVGLQLELKGCVRVGQRSLGNKIVMAVYLSPATDKVTRITASQLNNNGDVKDARSNKIIGASL